MQGNCRISSSIPNRDSNKYLMMSTNGWSLARHLHVNVWRFDYIDLSLSLWNIVDPSQFAFKWVSRTCQTLYKDRFCLVSEPLNFSNRSIDFVIIIILITVKCLANTVFRSYCLLK